MLIKLFICTYNNPTVLHTNLQSLFASDLMKYDHSITIINNYSKNFHVAPEFESRVNVMQNVMRPDWSWGHLSRTWNQALMHGFHDLGKPEVKYVMLSQDDVIYEPNWCEQILNKHAENYEFIQFGIGDMLMSFTAEGVRRIGIFDERFPQIGYQETDYFLRALICDADHISMNEPERSHNAFPEGTKICRRTHMEIHPYSANQMHCLGRQVFVRKWPTVPKPHCWDWAFRNTLPKKPSIPTYLTYPYFEKDIYAFGDKGYFCNFLDTEHFL